MRRSSSFLGMKASTRAADGRPRGDHDSGIESLFGLVGADDLVETMLEHLRPSEDQHEGRKRMLLKTV
jgi:hypothetical protein